MTFGLPPVMFPRCLGWVAVIGSDAKQGKEPASWWSLLYLRQAQPWSRTARVTWRPSNMGSRIVGIKEVSTSLVTFTFHTYKSNKICNSATSPTPGNEWTHVNHPVCASLGRHRKADVGHHCVQVVWSTNWLQTVAQWGRVILRE